MNGTGKMKAVHVTAFGGAEVLSLVELPIPQPGPGEILVRLDAIGVNYSDIVTRQGLRGGTPPYVCGQEGAGQIHGLGEGVRDLAEGDLVSFTGARTGTYAEFTAVNQDRVFKAPPGVTPEVAATLQIMGITVHYLMHDVFALGAGHQCLIHAGAGGVGHIAIQTAKAKGAKVFTTVGSAEKAELAKGYGADEVILYRDVDFKDRLLELTDGRGVDVVYDTIGKETIERSIACVAFQGTLVLFGDTSGVAAPVDTRALGKKAIYLTRVGMPSFIPDWESVTRRCSEMLALVEAGKVKLNIQPARRLAEAVEMHRDLEGRKTVGKNILVP